MLTWVDIETTGLDPKRHAILEVGLIVTDDQLEEIDSMAVVLSVTPRQLDRMETVVREMHEKSGLLVEAARSGLYIADADDQLAAWLRAVCPERSPMCGSSVHFDRKFLREHMPILESTFHYRNVDVSTVKELAQRWYPQRAKWSGDSKRHRGLSDIRDSLTELRYYRKELFK